MTPMTYIALMAVVATQIVTALYLARHLFKLEADLARLRWRLANARVVISPADPGRSQDSHGPHTHAATVVFPHSPEVLSYGR